MEGKWETYENDIWGARIEYQQEFVDSLRGKTLSEEDYESIANTIEKDDREAIVEVPSLGKDIFMKDFQWSSDMDFGHEYDGGGYMLGFGYDDYYDSPSSLYVLVEWYDSYAQESGHDERKDQDVCVRIGLDLLNDFLASLQ